MKNDVRILLVGDRGTGKTSLVLAFVKERFESEPPPCAEEVVIPPDITAAKVATYVVDSSLRVQDEIEIEAEIQKAGVICIVYAVDDQASFTRLTSHWLPLVRRTLASEDGRRRVPVILVGNKVDTRGEDDSPGKSLEMDIIPIMNEFPEVETCIECSAKLVRNISELVTLAQKAVLYPSPPIFDPQSHSLKPSAVAALTRIFRLSDSDKDGLLSDTEMSAFQATCFNCPMSTVEINRLKETIRNNCPDGIRDNALTCPGFIYLYKFFINHGYIETIWTVLWRFGYQDDLSLNPEFIHPPLNLNGDSSAELSPSGEAFLRDLFRRFDKAGTGALSVDQFQELWATAPQGDPWEDSALASSGGHTAMTLERFMSLWTLLVLDDPRRAVEYFAMLGYRTYSENASPADTAASAITIGRSRKIDREAGYTTRSVFLVYVFGQENAGKSTLLDRAGSTLLVHTPLAGQKTAMVSLAVRNTPITLVLREFAVPGADADVLSSPTLRGQCDVALFLYDTSDPTSFQYAANLYAKMAGGGPPCLFVASKADLTPSSQDYTESPIDFCARRGLPAPISGHDLAGLLAATADLCVHPQSPTTSKNQTSVLRRLAAGTLMIGAIAGAAYFAARFYRLRK